MSDAPTLAQLADNWELFRDPILVAAVAGGVLGYLGVFIVLRRMVFVAAALSQAAGAGVALAFFAQIQLGLGARLAEPRLWALGVTAAVAVVLGGPAVPGFGREGLLALAYLLGGASAMLLGTRISQEAHDIQAILFGTGVLVEASDVWWVGGAGLGIMVLQLWWRRGFWFASLDPDGARVRGLPVGWLDFALLGMIALFVAVATRALGALPVFAFSVLPALAAVQLARSPGGSLALATVLGAASGVLGYALAFVMQFPVGASQTVVAAALVVAAWGLRALTSALAGSTLLLRYNKRQSH